MVLTIVGARPQFIKAAVISRALRKQRSDVRELVIHTGQHYDAKMSEIFFDELGIAEPACNLGIGGGTHGQNTGRMIEVIEELVIEKRPDWVLVYGDTDSTLAGTLAAVKLHIPVAHVEAGLRSFNRRMPEEINRVLTDHASDMLFTPTDTATHNLVQEGISGDRVKQVGDVMLDASLFYSERAKQRSQIIDTLQLVSKDYILATIHRAENTDHCTRISDILAGLANSGRLIVWPMHPRTRQRLETFDLVLPENIRVIEPVGYLDMVMLERRAALIATDSGGVQKEAYFYGVPCVTLRDETEWRELVECGANTLVGTDPTAIAEAVGHATSIKWTNENLFGDGQAGKRIVDTLCESNNAV